jgi:HAD superfamily hydrolase (TIGR01509 family)
MHGFALVIFDCDGVLVDSEVLSCQCLADVLSMHGLPTTIDDVFARFLGRSFDVVATHYREARGGDLPPAFRDDLYRHLEATFRTSLKPMPLVFDVLDSLDCPFCLASSSEMNRIRLALALTGLDSVFGDRVFNAAMVARSKPAPDLFLFAAERMKADPGHALVIEDTVAGVVAGKAAGMTVWGFTGGSHYDGRRTAGELTEAGADRIFTSMAELSHA